MRTSNGKIFSVRKLKLALILGIGLTASPAAAENSSVAFAQTSAQILETLNLGVSSDFNFGSFTSSGADGTVLITTDGTRSATGGVSLVSGNASPAKFTVTGSSGEQLSVTGPSADVELTKEGGGSSLILTNIVISAPESLPTTPGEAAVIQVGGKLVIAANQAAGTYSGQFDLTVTYQ